MTPEEQRETLESGQRRISNGIGWGTSYLKKAGLIANGGKRATYVITEDGRKEYAAHGDGFNYDNVMSIPAVIEWISGQKNKSDQPAQPAKTFSKDSQEQKTTPSEEMETAFVELNDSLADELLSRIMANDPYFFERLVTELVIKLGYGDLSESASSVTQNSGDEGIDGRDLANLMIQYNVGVSTKQVFEVKAIDNDYFEYGE